MRGQDLRYEGDKMDIKEMDSMIKEAKRWLQANLPPNEKEEVWIAPDGTIQKCPKGTVFDSKTVSFIPLKR